MDLQICVLPYVMVAFVEQNQIEKIIREILKPPIPCSL
jgi:hypothetical protein